MKNYVLGSKVLFRIQNIFPLSELFFLSMNSSFTANEFRKKSHIFEPSKLERVGSKQNHRRIIFPKVIFEYVPVRLVAKLSFY